MEKEIMYIQEATGLQPCKYAVGDRIWWKETADNDKRVIAKIIIDTKQIGSDMALDFCIGVADDGSELFIMPLHCVSIFYK